MITSICSFISFQMGEYHSIFPSVASVLNHIFFVIGNGYELDEETQSPTYGNKPIHLFPKFNKEKMVKKMMPQWREYVEQRAKQREEFENDMKEMYEEMGEKRKSNWNKEAFIEKELAKYVFPEITPEHLTVESLYQQLVNEEENPRRKELGGEYEFVRPYPLSENHSLIYELNSKTPECVREVALNFCTAWLNYLNKELEVGRVYDGVGELGGYSNLKWTTKHRDMIQQLTVGKLAQCPLP